LSRNAEYQFIPTDTREIETQLVAMYETITKTTVHPSSPERLFIQWVANILIQERVLTNYAANQNIPSRAEGDNLDALAEMFYEQDRPEAKAAVCTMRFQISKAQETAILIRSGTRIQGGELTWETTEDHYIPIGETSIDVPVRCQTTGVIGNGYAAGQIKQLVDIYDYYSKCANITVSGGGADRATDEEFYELMRLSMDGYSSAGARGSYAYFAKKDNTEIGDVAVVSPVPGEIKLYVLMKDGTLAGEEVKREVLERCSADEVRPLADFVSVEDAEPVNYDIDFTYYIQTGTAKSAEAVAADVQAAVTEYVSWQCAKLGRDINPSELYWRLMATGIKRVELASPAFTVLRDGGERTAPQVAVIGTVTVTNGGYEDE
jgi:phage-related baseplate assembly protein